MVSDMQVIKWSIKNRDLNNKDFDKLIGFRGSIEEVCKKHHHIIPNDILMISELLRAINKGAVKEELFRIRAITSDGCVYALENKEPVIYLTRSEFNPAINYKNFDDALIQIKEKGYYDVKPEDFLLIREEANNNNGWVKRYKLSELCLEEVCFEESWLYFNKDYRDNLNKSQVSLIEHFIGKGNQAKKVMKHINKENKESAGFCFLSQEYVKAFADENKAISRISGIEVCMKKNIAGISIGFDNRHLLSSNQHILGFTDAIDKIHHFSFDIYLQISRMAEKYIPPALLSKFRDKGFELYEKIHKQHMDRVVR